MLMKLLTKRFGNISAEITSQIKRLEIPELELLAESLLDFNNVNDLKNWLKNHS
jgi:hypothetical protein